jgi:hypothetical protein
MLGQGPISETWGLAVPFLLHASGEGAPKGRMRSGFPDPHRNIMIGTTACRGWLVGTC